jgi:hypothetical protein
MSFYFNGVARWSGPFTSPNEFGALLAMLLPLAWWLTSTRRGAHKVWSGLLEVVLLFSLCRTYSRGALVAVGVAALFWLAAGLRRQSPNVWLVFLLRMSTTALLVLMSGFQARVSGEFIAADPSAMNRLEVWLRAFVMLGASPLHGWGWDRGGLHFNLWFADGLDFRTANLLSGNLQFMVETGLWGSIAGLTLAGLALSGPFLEKRQGAPESFGLASASACVAWITANSFSVLASSVALSAFAGILFIASWGSVARHGQRGLRAAAVCGGLAMVAWGTIYAGGLWLARNDPVVVSRNRDGDVVLRVNGATPTRRIHVFPDPAVTGDTGHLLKKLVAAAGPDYALIVHELADEPAMAEVDWALRFGRRLGDAKRAQRTMLIAPRLVDDRANRPQFAGLILPEPDIYGQEGFWLDLCPDGGVTRYSSSAAAGLTLEQALISALRKQKVL